MKEIHKMMKWFLKSKLILIKKELKLQKKLFKKLKMIYKCLIPKMKTNNLKMKLIIKSLIYYRIKFMNGKKKLKKFIPQKFKIFI